MEGKKGKNKDKGFCSINELEEGNLGEANVLWFDWR